MTIGTGITDVVWGSIQPRGDARGSFREVWRHSQFPRLTSELTGMDGARFVQANVSTSEAGVLRGLHYHRRQLDHWIVLAGRAFVALVDIRPALQGDRPIVETRELAPDATVTIPTGVAHGFLALTPLTLLYLVTNEYDGNDELGFAWDDPWVGVRWPTGIATPDGRPILSGRDQHNPPLAELIDSLQKIP
jgi:dTDP-4-dehydrorhamnose 3,5-epimerase